MKRLPTPTRGIDSRPTRRAGTEGRSKLGASIPAEITNECFVEFITDLRVGDSIVLDCYEPMTARETKPAPAYRSSPVDRTAVPHCRLQRQATRTLHRHSGIPAREQSGVEHHNRKRKRVPYPAPCGGGGYSHDPLGRALPCPSRGLWQASVGRGGRPRAGVGGPSAQPGRPAAKPNGDHGDHGDHPVPRKVPGGSINREKKSRKRLVVEMEGPKRLSPLSPLSPLTRHPASG